MPGKKPIPNFGWVKFLIRFDNRRNMSFCRNLISLLNSLNYKNSVNKIKIRFFNESQQRDSCFFLVYSKFVNNPAYQAVTWERTQIHAYTPNIHTFYI